MKKKFFALAIMCAMVALSVAPSVFAAEGDATVNVAGSTTISTAGAYSSGLHFNTTAGVTTELGAQADAATTVNGGTDLAIGSDYLLVASSDVTDAWTVAVTGASWSGTGTYTLASTSAATTLIVDVDGTDANSVVRASSAQTKVDLADGTCGVVSGDVTFYNRIVSTSSQLVAGFSTANAANCISYEMKLLIPVDITPINTGFSAGDDPTSTITFTIS